MNKTLRTLSKAVVVLGTALVASTAVQAGVVYDNTSPTSYLGQYLYSANEFGDEVFFGGDVKDISVTQFQLEYYLGHSANGDEKMRIRLYDNSGTPSLPLPGRFSEPGVLLYETADLTLATGFNTIKVDGLNLFVPLRNMTFTVQFSGVTGTETAGLLFYNPPTVGSSYSDYWEKVGGTWTLKTQPGLAANFGAYVTAVPEPTTIQLALAGALSFLGLATYRRFSK